MLKTILAFAAGVALAPQIINVMEKAAPVAAKRLGQYLGEKLCPETDARVKYQSYRYAPDPRDAADKKFDPTA